MITFGLTGGIACGKSTVTKTFRANNTPIVDADVVARQVVEVGTPGWQQIRSCFGDNFLNADQTINRIKLGTLVFANKQEMKYLNDIMGPLITAEAEKQIKTLHEAGNRIVGYDAALICEMGNASKYHCLVVVSCPQDMQIERLIKRNGLTHEDAMSRIAAQMPVADKVKMAKHVIDTSGTIEESIKQTDNVLHRIRKDMYQMMLDSGQITYNQVPWPWRDTAGNDDWED